MASSGSHPSSRRSASTAVSRRTVDSAISSSSAGRAGGSPPERPSASARCLRSDSRRGRAGPHVVDLPAAPLRAVPRATLPSAPRGLPPPHPVDRWRGRRPRAGVGAPRPARAPRRCPPVGARCPRAASVSTARRSTKPAILTSRSRRSTATCDRRSSRRRRASSATDSRPAAAGAAASNSGRRPVNDGEGLGLTLEALGQRGPVPLGLVPLLVHELELGLHPAPGALEPLALVVGPFGLAGDVDWPRPGR